MDFGGSTDNLWRWKDGPSRWSDEPRRFNCGPWRSGDENLRDRPVDLRGASVDLSAWKGHPPRSTHSPLRVEDGHPGRNDASLSAPCRTRTTVLHPIADIALRSQGSRRASSSLDCCRDPRCSPRRRSSARYSGDALWALLVYLMFRWLFPAHSVIRSAVYASVFALAVETSQLVHAPWIDALRSIRLVHLVLGSGFVWSDLLCYAIGIAIGACLEWTFGRRKRGSFLHTSTETGA